MINVCIAGATGWTGAPLARAVMADEDLRLVSAVSRSAAGKDLGEAWGSDPVGVPVFASVDVALDGVDVLVDYTSHESVKNNTLTALAAGVGVVIGSSGLTGADFDEIEAAATAASVGVVAAGNFSITAAMAQAASLLAARHLPQWEVIDYASSTKPDVPSGTAREMAERLSAVRPPEIGVPVRDIAGPKEARGADVDGTQVHSIRLPSFVVSTEVVFAQPDERLVIRHDAGSSPEPYVYGTLMAVRALPGRVGLTRGLDTLLLEA
ncbi:MAG: 4-hydroxy-tetrahydrodipicolinate reductase [Actinobacteria bacterium]|nr:4-hydroxy-tetrahydrodipicolinate reductase [Actinomycetota bacterium]